MERAPRPRRARPRVGILWNARSGAQFTHSPQRCRQSLRDVARCAAAALRLRPLRPRRESENIVFQTAFHDSDNAADCSAGLSLRTGPVSNIYSNT